MSLGAQVNPSDYTIYSDRSTRTRDCFADARLTPPAHASALNTACSFHPPSNDLAGFPRLACNSLTRRKAKNSVTKIEWGSRLCTENERTSICMGGTTCWIAWY